MSSTSITLLDRLKRLDDASAWTRFVRVYSPLLKGWAKSTGLDPQAIDEVTQNVFVQLLHKLQTLEYDSNKGSFRGWLRLITIRAVENYRRSLPRSLRSGEVELAAPAEFPLSEQEEQHRLLRGALAVVQGDVEPTTWRAFQEYALEGRPPAEVAAELGLTVASVYAAKSRILNRLRTEFAGLLD